HARHVIAQADLAAALWDLGKKQAHHVMRPLHEAPLAGSPQQSRSAQQATALQEQQERRAVREAEARAVRAAALEKAVTLDVPALVLAVTLLVCRYGPYPNEAEIISRELGL